MRTGIIVDDTYVLVSSTMMNTLNNLRGRGRGRPHHHRRWATLLAGLATLVGVPLVSALPAAAADLTLDCTPACNGQSLAISSPWEDKVHYTIDIAEDQPFWLYQAEFEPIFAITRDQLDDDGHFYIEDLGGDWGGLYYEPVDIDQVDAGLTAWRLRGSLDDWTFMGKGPNNFAVHSTDDFSDFNALARQTLWVESPQPSDSPTLESVALGRDMASIEFTYDMEFIEEDLTWGLTGPPGSEFPRVFPALPQTQSISVAPQGTFTGVNPTSIDIDGSVIIARFAEAFAAGSYSVNFETDQMNTSTGPFSVGLRKPQALFGTSVEAPAATPPALDTETDPVVNADGDELTLTFDYPIASTTPATSTLTVTAGGSAVAVSSIANSGATSVLTLASAISEGATVTVSYDAPDSNGFQDAAGNLVADFTNEEVTNNSTVAAPVADDSSDDTSSDDTTSDDTSSDDTTSDDTSSDDSTSDDTSSDDTASDDATSDDTASDDTTSTTPTLVTEENQEALTATAGSAKMLVNGEEVELSLTSTGADDAGAVAPAERTAEQVAELQAAADGLVERLDTAAGGDSGLEVVDTDTGAEIAGMFDDTQVPVEDVIVAEAAEFTGVYASRDEDGNPNQIRAEVLEMERGGEVVVYVYGLPAGESAELVLMSTPYLLGTATADANGNFSRALTPPEAILAGDHTLVTASETLTVSLGIRVTEPAAADTAADTVLPATGGEFPVAPVLFIIGLGSLLLVLSRRREMLGN